MATFYGQNPLLSINFASHFILQNNSSGNSTTDSVSPGTLTTGAQVTLTVMIAIACLIVIAACLYSARKHHRTIDPSSDHSIDRSNAQTYEQEYDEQEYEQSNNQSDYSSNNQSHYSSNYPTAVVGIDKSSLIDQSIHQSDDQSDHSTEHHRTRKPRQAKHVV